MIFLILTDVIVVFEKVFGMWEVTVCIGIERVNPLYLLYLFITQYKYTFLESWFFLFHLIPNSSKYGQVESR